MRLATSLLLALIVWFPIAARADDYPSKPVRIVVPWPPGGNIDITARTLAPALGEALGTTIVIDNKGGAGGTIGMSAAIKAPPDGYTLVLGSTATVTVAPSVYKGVDYNPLKDLIAIGPINSAPMVLTAASRSAVSTYEDFEKEAKKRSGQISVAHSGTGSSNHLAIELISMRTGLKLLPVPYKGSGPALNDLVAGQVEMMVDQVTASLPHIKEKRIKAIAVTTQKRVASLPDVPTLDELGLKGFEASTFTGLFASANLPKPVVDKLTAAHAKAMADPTVRARYAELGVDVLDQDIATFRQFVEEDYNKWLKVVTEAKISAD